MLIITSFTTGLVGCADKQDKAENTEVVSAGDIEGVKLRFAQEKLEDAELKQTYEEIFADYKKLSGVDVELEVITGDFPVWLATQHIANNAPDVVVTNYNISREDYKKGYVVDLGEYIDNPNPYNDNKPLSQNVRKSLLEECVDPDSGATTLLPNSVDGVRIIYNKTAFEKAGIEQVPNTYDEFLEVCQKLQASGITPLGFANASDSKSQLGWWMNILLSQMDAAIVEQMDLDGNGKIQKNEFVAATDKNLIDFTKEPFSKAYEMLKELVKYCNSDFNSVSEPQGLDLWLGEKVAMTLLISPQMKNIKNIENLGFEYDVMRCPILTEENYDNVTGKAPYIGGSLVNGYIVTKNEDPKKQAAAIDFVNYMLSPGTVEKLMEKSTILPSIDDVSEGNKKWIVSDSEYPVKASYFSISYFKEFAEYNLLSAQLYLSGELDEEEFLSGLNDEWKANCEKAKMENGWSEGNGYKNDES